MKTRRAYLLLILGAVFFAFNGIVSKWVMEAGLSPWRLTQIRCTGSGLVLFIYVVAKGRWASLKPAPGELYSLVIFGLIGVSAVQSFYFFSILKLHVSTALIIEFTAPIWIVIYLRFFKKVAISSTMWLGLGAAFLGLIMVGQAWKGLTINGMGVISGFFDAFSLAIYFVLGRSLGKVRSTESILVWGFGVTAVAYALAKPWWTFPSHVFIQSVDLKGRYAGHHLPGWVLLVFVVLLGTVLPYICVLSGLSSLSAQIASIIGMLEPVLAGVFGWILLRETFNTIQLLGAAVVLVGIFIANEKVAVGSERKVDGQI
jgi:drug/metabolite transporter (DMT)-like permease